jgi:hypothetical protein
MIPLFDIGTISQYAGIVVVVSSVARDMVLDAAKGI